MERKNLLQVRHEVREDAVIVTARGELDLLTTSLLTEELATACKAVEPPTPVVVDLQEITFIGSAAIGGLVQTHQDCTNAGTPLRIVARDRAVLRPLNMLGLDRTFEIADEIETAVAMPIPSPEHAEPQN